MSCGYLAVALHISHMGLALGPSWGSSKPAPVAAASSMGPWPLFNVGLLGGESEQSDAQGSYPHYVLASEGSLLLL